MARISREYAITIAFAITWISCACLGSNFEGTGSHLIYLWRMLAGAGTARSSDASVSVSLWVSLSSSSSNLDSVIPPIGLAAGYPLRLLAVEEYDGDSGTELLLDGETLPLSAVPFATSPLLHRLVIHPGLPPLAFWLSKRAIGESGAPRHPGLSPLGCVPVDPSSDKVSSANLEIP